MEDLEPDVRDACLKCRTVFQKLHDHMQPLFATPKEDLKCLAPVDKARLNIALAYAVVNFYQMYLRTQGETILPSHPIYDEQRRVQGYLTKLKDATDVASRRTLPNQAAAARLLGHVLGKDGTGGPPKKKPKPRPQKAKTQPQREPVTKAASPETKQTGAEEEDAMDVDPEGAETEVREASLEGPPEDASEAENSSSAEQAVSQNDDEQVANKQKKKKKKQKGKGKAAPSI